MDAIAKLFKEHCGPDVNFISGERIFREIKITYSVPRYDPDRVFYIRVAPDDGTHAALRRVVLRSAEAALGHAYRVTGQREMDMERLLKGRLVDDKQNQQA